jgi:hypothetical protein
MPPGGLFKNKRLRSGEIFEEKPVKTTNGETNEKDVFVSSLFTRDQRNIGANHD